MVLQSILSLKIILCLGLALWHSGLSCCLRWYHSHIGTWAWDLLTVSHLVPCWCIWRGSRKCLQVLGLLLSTWWRRMVFLPPTLAWSSPGRSLRPFGHWGSRWEIPPSLQPLYLPFKSIFKTSLFSSEYPLFCVGIYKSWKNWDVQRMNTGLPQYRY